MRNIKQIALGLLLAGTLVFSGCSTVKGIFGKSATKEAAQANKIENVDSLLGGNVRDKLSEMASINYGVDYALSKESNPSKNIEVAKDLNTRAMSISGAPSIDEMKKMKQMIDDLTSQLQTEKDRGKAALDDKDNQIYALQLETKTLETAKNAEIKKYMKIAQDTAMKADTIQSQLDKMNSFFGLGAVFYGLKRFIFSMAWILGIGSILFLILRFASMSNPIAASIFSIFNQVGAWAINIIKVLVPKALDVAGHTATTVFNSYRSTLFKIVDAIQMAKANAVASGKPSTDLNAVLDEVAKSMNSDEKAIVDEIKKSLNWK